MPISNHELNITDPNTETSRENNSVHIVIDDSKNVVAQNLGERNFTEALRGQFYGPDGFVDRLVDHDSMKLIEEWNDFESHDPNVHDIVPIQKLMAMHRLFTVLENLAATTYHGRDVDREALQTALNEAGLALGDVYDVEGKGRTRYFKRSTIGLKETLAPQSKTAADLLKISSYMRVAGEVYINTDLKLYLSEVLRASFGASDIPLKLNKKILSSLQKNSAEGVKEMVEHVIHYMPPAKHGADLDTVIELANQWLSDTARKRVCSMLTNDGSTITIVPGVEVDMDSRSTEKVPLESKIIVDPEQVAKLITRQRALQAERDEDRARAKHEQRIQEDARIDFNKNITNEINAVIAERQEQIGNFRYSRKALRSERLVGPNSVQYTLNRVAEKYALDTSYLDEVVQTYAGLRRIETPEMLQASIAADKEFRTRYQSLLDSYIGQRPAVADTMNIERDIEWLKNNWVIFKDALAASGNQLSEKDVRHIEVLIGLTTAETTSRDSSEETAEEMLPEDDDIALAIDTDEESATTNPEENSEVVMPKTIEKSTIDRIIAEQLGWVALPVEDGQDPVDYIYKDIKDTLNQSGKSSLENKVMKERIEDLLHYQALLDGELYRSAQRVLGDSNNLYLVLKFNHDGEEYVIAENPVYGNATYVAKASQFPLQDGETILSAVKEFSRRDMRYFGTKAIPHKENSYNVSHLDKVLSAIDSLAVTKQR